ncbi:tripartite tricarboxylate transporter substrate binding protein [Zwartia panacis]|uniref:tripartite tricarboxylate transporter substrate binding protein n=1 Tax=Zwartia panacis TaxID=2683345 RepID=UPI0025B3CD5E|nr:tripartite tricarboxylate transporter substrate binding protein [Zwartia panacis]MDN4015545.1 tripartite tricarboxylate transporter substrate binding protein [Zwartia panacis]
MVHTTRAFAKFAKLSLTACVFSWFSLTASSAAAQTNYPTKPIKLIVGFAPGGGSDLIARLVAAKLGPVLGQSVIVENKPGAGGNLAAELALKSPADGYTLFLSAASYTVNPSFYKLPFDSGNDMTPIALLARGPFIIAATKSFPANTLQEFVTLAKASPGKYSFATSGQGSITQMATEYFNETAGINLLHIPYKGTSPALTDTVAGHTDIIFGTVASTLPLVSTGQLKALAVTTPKRLSALPDVPTVMESGYPSYEVTNWHGIIAPKGVPVAIQQKLNKAINQVLQDKEMEKTLTSDGLTAAALTPEQFGELLRSEIARWGALAKSRGLSIK